MPRRWVPLLAFVGYFLAVVAGQIARNAELMPFGSRFSDEPAHYVTALMVRHYATTALGTNPMRFAEGYYARLPKVAIGHWPPGLYAALAPFVGWGDGDRAMALVGVAFLHAAAAWLCYRLALPLAGPGWSLLAGLATTLMPASRELADAMMAEPLVSVCELLAVAAAAKLFAADGGQRRQAWLAVGFGAACAAAVLTKGTGFRLALLPPIGWLLLRDWRGPTRWPWWLAAAVVVAIAGPWYAFTRGLQSRHLELAQGGGFALIATAAWFYLRVLWANLGVVAAALLFVLAILRTAPLAPDRRALVAALFAHAAAVLFFQTVVVPRVGVEPRHVHSALFSLAALAAWACRKVGEGRPSEIASTVWNAALAFAFLAPIGLRPDMKGELSLPVWKDYGKEVQWLGATDFVGHAVLAAAHPNAEGAVIAALAENAGPRPGFVVLRSSKLLAESDWMGGGYRMTVDSEAAALARLREARIGAVALNSSEPLAEHDRLLRSALGNARDEWVPNSRDGHPGWKLWRRIGAKPLASQELSDLGRTWNLGEAQGFRGKK